MTADSGSHHRVIRPSFISLIGPDTGIRLNIGPNLNPNLPTNLMKFLHQSSEVIISTITACLSSL